MSTRSIETEAQLITRLQQMGDLLDQERAAIVSSDTEALVMLAGKKQELTEILAMVSPEILTSIKSGLNDERPHASSKVMELISINRVRNSVNGSMLTQARNMTDKSISILRSCIERNPVELYDEYGNVPDLAKKRALGSA